MTATVIKERPILFSGPMVRAILDGRKTMTRRIMKPQPEYFGRPPHWRWKPKRGIGAAFGPFAVDSGDRPGMFAPWQVGDHLWVKETWQQIQRIGRGEFRTVHRTEKLSWATPIYSATLDGDEPPRWMPSIHMPRWASRITLEITGVRVERLKDMRAADVVAEGFPFSSDLDQFKLLWNKLNCRSSWESNPWVWVVEFKQC